VCYLGLFFIFFSFPSFFCSFFGVSSIFRLFSYAYLKVVTYCSNRSTIIKILLSEDYPTPPQLRFRKWQGTAKTSTCSTWRHRCKLPIPRPERRPARSQCNQVFPPREHGDWTWTGLVIPAASEGASYIISYSWMRQTPTIALLRLVMLRIF
jgi:hypothetical protein